MSSKADIITTSRIRATDKRQLMAVTLELRTITTADRLSSERTRHHSTRHQLLDEVMRLLGDDLMSKKA